jgi:hypothetical protein
VIQIAGAPTVTNRAAPAAEAYLIAHAEAQNQAEGPECDPRQRIGRARYRGRAKFGGITHEKLPSRTSANGVVMRDGAISRYLCRSYRTTRE